MIFLPGKTIGILGGGQLGRMSAIAAKRMGYRVLVFDPTPDCPAGQVCDGQITAAYDNIAAARQLAAACDVLTFEFENIPADTLAALEHIRPVRPSPHVLATTRHRLREKDFLRKSGFPVADYAPIASLGDLKSAVQRLGFPAILKSCELGYDGKGQARINGAGDIEAAFKSVALPPPVLRGRVGEEAGAPVYPAVLEAFVPFTREVSVICARAPDGQAEIFGPMENVHTRHILDITTIPAAISPRIASAAAEMGREIAKALDLVGLICVEFFHVEGAGGEKLVVNELAPRPHNSGHFSFDACITSQFEQHIRAVCGLPLGDPTLLRPAAMANLLGDLWPARGEPNWAALLAHWDVKLHLYGKAAAAPGRKMGHITAMGASAEEAREKVLRAREALGLPISGSRS